VYKKRGCIAGGAGYQLSRFSTVGGLTQTSELFEVSDVEGLGTSQFGQVVCERRSHATL
jgi:hypothetical protein